MPKPFVVDAPSALLERCFLAWPEEKKSRVRGWLKHQAITVNGRPVSQFDHALAPGDEVAVRSDRFAAPRTVVGSGLLVFYEDADLIVVDKPANLLSIASEREQERTAYRMLTERVRWKSPVSRERVWIVHRLDRETSGLMVFAKTPAAKEALQGGWDQVEKRYEAVVEGTIRPAEGILESDLDESNPYKVVSCRPGPETRHAITRYRLISTGSGRSLIELSLETGRRHQIRVQLSDAGCPIVGDRKYGASSDPAKRLGLHSCGLCFRHPVTGRVMRFASPLPKILGRLIRNEPRDLGKPATPHDR